MSKRFIKTKSNYVLKEKHQNVKSGEVFERDFMTISDFGGYTSGQVPVYGQGNFKMTIRNGINGQKKHRYGDWELNDVACGDDKTLWTLGCLPNSNKTTRDSKITINPNYTSLSDFAYFGSAVELVKTSIYNIIENFPGELTCVDEQIKYINEKGEEAILGGDDKYVVDNPFLIDMFSEAENAKNKVIDLRYLFKSYGKYEIIDVNNKAVPFTWELIKNHNKPCYVDGELISQIQLTTSTNVYNFYQYFYNGDVIVMHDGETNGFRIRPILKEIDFFYEDKLNDFQKYLLNNESIPKYKVTFDTPVENEYGMYITKKSYIWPINKNGWNIDVNNDRFKIYLEDLINLALFYDDNYSNNMWRSLTHESIKNLDRTTEIVGEDVIETKKIEQLFKIFGYQFDELKMFIDAIKSINTITYDGKNNIPTYFLTDNIEMSGWEVSDSKPSNDIKIKTNQLYSGLNKLYTVTDAHEEFLKRLKLNSKYILSHKGTKQSIEMVMSLFGIPRNWYSLKEFVEVVKTYPNKSQVELYNKLKNNYITEYNTIEEDFQGLPVKEVILTDKDGKIIANYLIPWFDKLSMIDGDPYFQMKGGWGYMKSKKINLSIAPNVKEINGNGIIYNETNKYLKVVENLNKLLNLTAQSLNNNDVYYVSNISNLKELSEGFQISDPSNYFIYNNTNDYDNKIGVTWLNVPEGDIEKGINNGVKVLYLESLIDNDKGNNPHIGYNQYDNGSEYLEIYKKLFRYALSTNNFSTDIDIDVVDKLGFEIEKQVDNKKTWYFTNSNSQTIYYTKDDKGNIVKDSYHKIGKNQNYKLGINSSYVNNEIYDDYKDINLRECNLIPSNPENPKDDELYDEAVANSIINVKMISLINHNKDDYFKDYLINVILPYVKQVVPSTSIFILDEIN